MPLLKDHFTSEDYWNLPEGERAELIDGRFYNMAPPAEFIRRFLDRSIRLYQITSMHITVPVRSMLRHLP